METVWRTEAEVGFGQLNLFDPSTIAHSEALAVEVPHPSQHRPLDKRPEAQSEESARIEDAGAELSYNRRNRIRTAKTWKDIADLHDALKVKEATKENFWPKPDYAQLIADGMQPIIAHLVKQVYDGIAAKPNLRVGTSADEAIQTYIRAIERVRDGTLAWATDPHALAAWAGHQARMAGAMLGRRIALSEIAEDRRTPLSIIYPDGPKAFPGEVTSLGGNSFYKNLSPGYDEVNRAIKAVDKGWPGKREAWQVQGMTILENPEIEAKENPHHPGSFLLRINGKYIDSFQSQEAVDIAASLIQPYVLFDKRGLVASFESEEEAINAARERSKRGKGKTIDASGTNVTLAVRSGPPRRMEGEDVSSEKLRQTFGFKGVNFGNWLKTPAAKAEAQLHLNHAYDAFHDLAEILGVPPQAISLGGMLGLAIGAQGGGGTASAHFVPGLNEINITRTTGAGFVAHEWGHALDHYFANMAGLSTSSEPYLTEHVTRNPVERRMEMVGGKYVTVERDRFGDVRPEIREAFLSIVRTMNKRGQTDEEARAQRKAAAERTETQLERWLKSIRRDFTTDNGVHPFDELANRIRHMDYGDGKVAAGQAYLSPVVVEMRELYKKQGGRLYNLENSKALQSWMDSRKYALDSDKGDTKHTPQMVSTEYAMRSRALDETKGGKPYWSTNCEKFARAFDAYIADTLEARNAENSYLSSASRTANTLPAGEERKAINGAFKALIGEIRTQETERGPIMFSLDDQQLPAIETEAFKAFFGDSKVVRNGRPKMMYHGARVFSNGLGDVEVFDRKATERLLRRPQNLDMIGSWFSDNPDSDGAAKYAGSDGVIYPVYLSIKNPLVLNSFDDLLNAWKDENTSRFVSKEIRKLAKLNPWNGDADGFVDLLKAEGYDGIRIMPHSTARSSEFADQDVWIAFDPHQVKAAYGNNRQFSRENPSILYSIGEDEKLPGLSVAEVTEEVQRLKGRWKNMPETIVVETTAELPFAAPLRGNAALQDGRMYLVAENMHSIEQLQKVLAHECVGHYSLEEMLGAKKFDELCSLVQALKASGDTQICTIASEVGARYSGNGVSLTPKEESKEIIARAVERCVGSEGDIKIEFAWLKGTFADFASWLRDKGFNVPFTHYELEGLVANAGAWIQERPWNRVAERNGVQRGEVQAHSAGRVSVDVAAAAVREAIPAPLQALPVKLACETSMTRFVGPVVGTGGQYVAQNIGREIALHKDADLMRVPGLGENVVIRYSVKDRAEVSPRSKSSEHGR